jgi:ADP-ribose pyrophosphatase YjhB (NUDIX family)
MTQKNSDNKSSNKHYEVWQGAVLVNQKNQVLLTKNTSETYGFVGTDLLAGERWDKSLKNYLKEKTGISDMKIIKVLHVEDFQIGVVGNPNPKYGVFILCTTRQEKLNNPDCQWVSNKNELSRLPLFHPLVKELVLKAFAYKDNL